VEIRRAAEPDAAGIAAVHVATWQSAYRGLLPDEHLDALDPVRYTAGWRRLLTAARPRAATLVAVVDGSVVGFVDVGPSRDDDGGEVTSIYVRPGSAGTGVGRALLAAATDRLRADGFEHAVLWVLRDNTRARCFYASSGWAPDGAAEDVVVAGCPVTEVRYRRALVS